MASTDPRLASDTGPLAMTFTPDQMGTIGENEFWKLAVLQTGGRVVPHHLVPDDDRVDFLVFPRGSYEPTFLFQVKTTARVVLHRRRKIILIKITAKEKRVITNPHYWYFAAWFNRPTMQLGNPSFLIPSEYLHRTGRRDGKGGVIFDIAASIEQSAHDRWVPFRTSPAELGPRIEALLASPPAQAPEQRRQWLELTSRLRQYSSAG